MYRNLAKKVCLGLVLFGSLGSSLFSEGQKPDEWVFDLSAGTSARCPDSDKYSLDRPGPADQPTRVAVGLYFMDILAIRETEQTITADVWIVMKWRDERLADASRGEAYANCNLSPNQVWMPRFQIRNLREAEQYYPDIYLVDAEGHTVLLRRLLLTVFSGLDLREFPFDQQSLNFGLDPIEGTQEVELEVLDRFVDLQQGPSVGSWIFERPEAETVKVFGPVRQATFSSFTTRIEARRQPGFFVRKLIIPVALIVFMAYAIFWINPSQIAPQMGAGTTSMLTLIAYHFALDTFLPRISYLTKADTFLLLSLLLVFIALMEAVTTAALERIEKVDLIHKIDRFFRVCYPLAFVLIVVISVF